MKTLTGILGLIPLFVGMLVAVLLWIYGYRMFACTFVISYLFFISTMLFVFRRAMKQRKADGIVITYGTKIPIATRKT